MCLASTSREVKVSVLTRICANFFPVEFLEYSFDNGDRDFLVSVTFQDFYICFEHNLDLEGTFFDSKK